MIRRSPVWRSHSFVVSYSHVVSHFSSRKVYHFPYRKVYHFRFPIFSFTISSFLFRVPIFPIEKFTIFGFLIPTSYLKIFLFQFPFWFPISGPDSWRAPLWVHANDLLRSDSYPRIPIL